MSLGPGFRPSVSCSGLWFPPHVGWEGPSVCTEDLQGPRPPKRRHFRASPQTELRAADHRAG